MRGTEYHREESEVSSNLIGISAGATFLTRGEEGVTADMEEECILVSSHFVYMYIYILHTQVAPVFFLHSFYARKTRRTLVT